MNNSIITYRPYKPAFFVEFSVLLWALDKIRIKRVSDGDNKKLNANYLGKSKGIKLTIFRYTQTQGSELPIDTGILSLTI